jgi:hypothetical protein
MLTANHKELPAACRLDGDVLKSQQDGNCPGRQDVKRQAQARISKQFFFKKKELKNFFESGLSLYG